MRLTQARPLFFMSLLTYVLCTAAVSASSAAFSDYSNDKKHLIVIGASYVNDWGQPDIPGFVVTNKGIGGEETWRIAARFQRDALAFNPDAVLIWGHTNDFVRAPAHQYRSVKLRVLDSYRQMIVQARATQNTIILATDVTLPTAVTWREWIPALFAWIRGGESFQARINREIRSVNDWLRVTAAQENIPLLEFERTLNDERGGRKLEYSQNDRSHLSTAGYVAITEYTRERLYAMQLSRMAFNR
jgi:lysophospholipase L1-like esterase